MLLRKHWNRLGVLLLLLVMVVPLAVQAQEDELPQEVLAARPGMHPEGIEWYAEGGTFLTGSLTEGTIFAVADDGTVTPFIEDEMLMASIGIHIDEATGRLLVANSDFAATGSQDVRGVAQLGIFDLETGERLHFVDMSDLYEDGRNFANDVTADADGNAYVTNSFSPVIYKVDMDGNAGVFLESEQFAVPGFGLNGIDYHEGGYLLVAVAGTGSLYKVPLDDPQTLTRVEVGESVGIDGMVVDDAGDVIAVATTMDDAGNSMSEIVMLSSDDDWATASITARAQAMPQASPTTVALRDGVPYVVHAHFSGIGADEPVQEFEILRIDFEMGDMME